ncbi:Protein of unknown function [Gryllus bimaculatus]|nr:Protein of unknown function [Gryllus bimaculatus]
MTLFVPSFARASHLEEIFPKISIRTWKSEDEFSAIVRDKTNKRYAMFYSSEVWQMCGALIHPELRFYRAMRDSTFYYQPHFCSRRLKIGSQ